MTIPTKIDGQTFKRFDKTWTVAGVDPSHPSAYLCRCGDEYRYFNTGNILADPTSAIVAGWRRAALTGRF
jgi:hypothetical protein